MARAKRQRLSEDVVKIGDVILVNRVRCDYCQWESNAEDRKEHFKNNECRRKLAGEPATVTWSNVSGNV